MKGQSTYTYANGDLLEERNSYTYTEYHGDVFFADWRDARANVSQQLGASLDAPAAVGALALETTLEGERLCTSDILESLMDNLMGQETDGLVRDTLARLVGRFEVSKRVHSHYLGHWRAAPGADYHDLALYLRYAEVMEIAYSLSGKIEYLNVLLKVLDTLATRATDLPAEESGRLTRLFSHEQIHIEKLLQHR